MPQNEDSQSPPEDLKRAKRLVAGGKVPKGLDRALAKAKRLDRVRSKTAKPGSEPMHSCDQPGHPCLDDVESLRADLAQLALEVGPEAAS